jgi:hypothetical protein
MDATSYSAEPKLREQLSSSLVLVGAMKNIYMVFQLGEYVVLNNMT